MSNTIDVLIARLRKKIDAPGQALAHRDRARHGLPAAMKLFRVRARADAARDLRARCSPRSSSSLLAWGTRTLRPQHDLRRHRRRALHALRRARLELRARGPRGVQARHAEGRASRPTPSSSGSRTTRRSSSGATTPVAASGNLLKTRLPGGIAPYRDRPEVPYTAVEPYSGQNRTCRFLVTHLQGKARGATLVLFRWIGPNLRDARRASTGRSSDSSCSGSSGPRRSSRAS